MEVLDAGADDYIVKPFSFNELLARIRAILRRPQESLPVELRAGDITLNIATHEAFRGKRELFLTTKEFALLEYFLRHPNRVLDREQLINHLWGFDFDSFSL